MPDIKRDGIVVRFPDSATPEQIDRFFERRRQVAAQKAQFKEQAPQESVPSLPSMPQAPVASMARQPIQPRVAPMAQAGAIPGINANFISGAKPIIDASKQMYRQMREDLLTRADEAAQPDSFSKRLGEALITRTTEFRDRESYDPYFAKTLRNQAEQYSEDAWNRKYGNVTPQSIQEMAREIPNFESFLRAGQYSDADVLAALTSAGRGAYQTFANTALGIVDLAPGVDVGRVDTGTGTRLAFTDPNASKVAEIGEAVGFGAGQAAATVLMARGATPSGLLKETASPIARRAFQTAVAATQGGLAAEGDWKQQLKAGARAGASMAIGGIAEKFLGLPLRALPDKAKIFAVPVIAGGGGNILGEIFVTEEGQQIDPKSIVAAGVLGTVFSWDQHKTTLDPEVRARVEAARKAEAAAADSGVVAEEGGVPVAKPLSPELIARRQQTVANNPTEIQRLIDMGMAEGDAIDIAGDIEEVRGMKDPKKIRAKMSEISARVAKASGRGPAATNEVSSVVDKFNDPNLPADVMSEVKNIVSGRTSAPRDGGGQPQFGTDIDRVIADLDSYDQEIAAARSKGDKKLASRLTAERNKLADELDQMWQQVESGGEVPMPRVTEGRGLGGAKRTTLKPEPPPEAGPPAEGAAVPKPPRGPKGRPKVAAPAPEAAPKAVVAPKQILQYGEALSFASDELSSLMNAREEAKRDYIANKTPESKAKYDAAREAFNSYKDKVDAVKAKRLPPDALITDEMARDGGYDPSTIVREWPTAQPKPPAVKRPAVGKNAGKKTTGKTRPVYSSTKATYDQAIELGARRLRELDQRASDAREAARKENTAANRAEAARTAVEFAKYERSYDGVKNMDLPPDAVITDDMAAELGINPAELVREFPEGSMSAARESGLSEEDILQVGFDHSRNLRNQINKLAEEDVFRPSDELKSRIKGLEDQIDAQNEKIRRALNGDIPLEEIIPKAMRSEPGKIKGAKARDLAKRGVVRRPSAQVNPVVKPPVAEARPVVEAKPAAEAKPKAPGLTKQQIDARLAELTPRQRKVYDFIKSRVAGGNRAPTQEEIAAELGVSRSSAQKFVDALVNKGVIRKSGSGRRNLKSMEEEPGTPVSKKPVISPEAENEAPPTEVGAQAVSKGRGIGKSKSVKPEAESAPPPTTEPEVSLPQQRIKIGMDAFDEAESWLKSKPNSNIDKAIDDPQAQGYRADVALRVIEKFGSRRVRAAIRVERAKGGTDADVAKRLRQRYSDEVLNTIAVRILRAKSRAKAKGTPEKTRYVEPRATSEAAPKQAPKLPTFDQRFKEASEEGYMSQDAKRIAEARAKIDKHINTIESTNDPKIKANAGRMLRMAEARLRLVEQQIKGRSSGPMPEAVRARKVSDVAAEKERLRREYQREEAMTPEERAADAEQRLKQALEGDYIPNELPARRSPLRAFDEILTKNMPLDEQAASDIADSLESGSHRMGKALASMVRTNSLHAYIETERALAEAEPDRAAKFQKDMQQIRKAFEQAEIAAREPGNLELKREMDRIRDEMNRAKTKEERAKLEDKYQKAVNAYENSLPDGENAAPELSLPAPSGFGYKRASAGDIIGERMGFGGDTARAISPGNKIAAELSAGRVGSREGLPDPANIDRDRAPSQYAGVVARIAAADAADEARSLGFTEDQVSKIAEYENAQAVIANMPDAATYKSLDAAERRRLNGLVNRARGILDEERRSPSVPARWKQRGKTGKSEGPSATTKPDEGPAGKGTEGEITYYGSMGGPVINDLVNNFAKHGIPRLKEYGSTLAGLFKTMANRAAEGAGKAGADFRDRLVAASDSMRKYQGRLSKSYRALKESSAGIGVGSLPYPGNAQRKAALELSRLTRVAGENFAEMPLIVEAVEGRYDGHLTAEQQKIVDAARGMSAEALNLAKEVGVLRLNRRTGKYEPIEVSEEASGNIWRRIPTQYMHDIMMRGVDHPDWGTMVDAFAKLNPKISRANVQNILLSHSATIRGDGRGMPGNKRVAIEFFREFKNAPAALYTGVVGNAKPLFEINPSRWADGMLNTTSTRLGVIDAFGQNISYDPETMEPDFKQGPVDKLREDYANSGGKLSVFDETMDAVEGRAVEPPGRRSVPVLGGIAKWSLGFINSTIKGFKLSASGLYNYVEPFGSATEQAGLPEVIKAYGESLSSGLYNLTNGKFGSTKNAAKFRALEEMGAIGVGRVGSQRMVEGIAARSMQLRVEKMRARGGKRSASGVDQDTVRLRQMGYSIDDARRLASGAGTDAEYDAIVRRASPQATGGRLGGAEISRIEQSALFKEAFPIARYAFTQARQFVRTMRLLTDSIKPMNTNEASAATTKIATTIAGRAAGGVAQGVLFGALMGGRAGLEAIISEMQEDPEQVILRGLTSAVFSGPYSGITQQMMSEDGGLARAIFPIAVLKESSEIILGEGRYKDLELYDRVEEGFKWLIPALKAGRGMVNLVGSMLGDEDIQYETAQARRVFNQWFRNNKISRTSGFIVNPSEEQEKRSAAMRRFRRAVSDRDNEAIIRNLEEAFGARSGGDLNKAIMNDRILSGLTKEGMTEKQILDDLRRTIGDRNYRQLLANDKLLELLANQFAGKGKRKITVFPKAGIGRVLGQMNK